MSMKYLGSHFDIHTGGIDHIPIHHTNEIAQSEGATGKKWVNYWLHNEFLVIAKDRDDTGNEETGGGKMSKSSGNFLTLQSLIDAGYDPLDYRFFLLGAHYRSQIAFSWDAMESAKNARKALIQRVAAVVQQAGTAQAGTAQAVSATGTVKSEAGLRYLEDFREALENDLGTPRALSALQTAVKDKALPPEEKLALLAQMDGVFALGLEEGAQKLLLEKSAATDIQSGSEDPEIDALVSERTQAKKEKNYKRADEIRAKLLEKGIVLEDTPSGTLWKRK
jgi:cysteinyl-tRNA synthetase